MGRVSPSSALTPFLVWIARTRCRPLPKTTSAEKVPVELATTVAKAVVVLGLKVESCSPASNTPLLLRSTNRVTVAPGTA